MKYNLALIIGGLYIGQVRICLMGKCVCLHVCVCHWYDVCLCVCKGIVS